MISVLRIITAYYYHVTDNILSLMVLLGISSCQYLSVQLLNCQLKYGTIFSCTKCSCWCFCSNINKHLKRVEASISSICVPHVPNLDMLMMLMCLIQVIGV